MALTPQNNEAFLREVDEALRQDQARQFATKYGMWLIAAVVAGLALLGGWLFWQHHREQAAGIEGEQLQAAYDALGANDMAGASAKLGTLAQSSSDGYRALAKFTQADIQLKNDDLKGAAASFGAIAADTSVAEPFRDLALIRQTTAEFDTLKPEVVTSRLRNLAVPGNAYFGSAGELVAAAYLKQGRRDLAGQMFARVAKDASVPASVRQRAVQMAGVLGVDAVAANEGQTKQ